MPYHLQGCFVADSLFNSDKDCNSNISWQRFTCQYVLTNIHLPICQYVMKKIPIAIGCDKDSHSNILWQRFT